MKHAACLAMSLAAALVGTEARAIQLNDTGQIDCYDDTATSTGTVSAGNPAPEAMGFEGQDCSLGTAAADAVGVQHKVGASLVPGRDYTKIANDGSELPASAARGDGPSDWGCTRDNITGLIWELRSSSGPRSSAHRYAWGSSTPDNAGTCSDLATCNTDSYAQAISTGNLCGRSDWRLPTPMELGDLIAYQASLAASAPNLIDPTYFPDISSLQAADGMWTDTSINNSLVFAAGTSAYAVDFVNGVFLELSKASEVRMRMVSGTAPFLPGRFSKTDKGGGEFTTVDIVTGLEWKTCVQGRSGSDCATGTESMLTWPEALAAGVNETFAGHSDWRLPSISELATIRDFAASQFSTIDAAAFPNSDLGFATYWSSTSDPQFPSSVFTHRYQSTLVQGSGPKSGTTLVRLVRGGLYLSTHAPGADVTPDSFSFAGKSAPVGSLVESDPITVAGLGVPASLRASGAAQSAYSINGGDWSTLAAAVRNGDTVRVRHLAAASLGATAVTTVNIGASSATFTSTATAAPPAAPTNVVATRGNASASLSFTAPASDGGSPITGYTATSSPAGGSSSCSAPPATSCLVTGLTNGTAYTFTVVASNAAGNSPPSPPSDPPVTPATVPGTPTALSAVAGIGQATVTFTAPGDNGGSAITGYAVASNPPGGSGACSAPPATSCTVTGLANGQSYTFTVTASNALGAGAASVASNSVTTPAPPGAPTNAVATASQGASTVTISFAAPGSSGGSPILDFEAISSPGNVAGTCTASPCTVSGLSFGTSYSFTVRARNAVGFGAASTPSNAVVLRAAPTITFEGTPRSSFPLNHNGGFFLLLRNPDLTLVVDDADTADLSTLALEVTSSNPSLLPAPVNGFDGVHLFDANATPNTRSATLRPLFNQTGTATLTFTVRDADGLTGSVQVVATIEEGNRVPFADYSANSIRLPVDAQAGAFQVPGFLTSASPGEGEELAQIVTHRFVAPFDAVGTITAPGIDVSGTLRFNLSSIPSSSTGLVTWPTDNGSGDLARCTGDNVLQYFADAIRPLQQALSIPPMSAPVPAVVAPCGAPRVINIVRAGVNLIALGVERTATRSPAGKSSAKAAGVDYTIRVRNDGSLPVEAVDISAPAVAALGNSTWTCSTTAGTCSPASGQGAILTTVDLDLDEEALVVISGSVSEATTHVSITPTVTFAEGVTGTVFGNGVQRIDAVSNAFLFLGTFEGEAL